jgi:hypothetical protein
MYKFEVNRLNATILGHLFHISPTCMYMYACFDPQIGGYVIEFDTVAR